MPEMGQMLLIKNQEKEERIAELEEQVWMSIMKFYKMYSLWLHKKKWNNYGKRYKSLVEKKNIGKQCMNNKQVKLWEFHKNWLTYVNS